MKFVLKILEIQPKEMPESISYHEELITTPKDPLETASYIEVVLEEGDPKMLLRLRMKLISQNELSNYTRN